MLNAYFSVAERCMWRLVRLRWAAGRPEFYVVWPRVTLIAMGEPTYELDDDRRAIKVAVEGGALVSPASGAYLSLALERQPRAVQARIELLGYQPRAAHNAVVRWLYAHTQTRVHEWVGQSYLRQLYQEWLQA
jgi:hypothetical protein